MLHGNALDVAVNGSGYFQVLLPSGETAYTRAGNFSMNGQGQLVTQDGYQVIPQIAIPQGSTNITISQAGQVQVVAPGAKAPTIVGTLQLATFLNPAGLEATGNNLFTETSASGAPTVGVPGVAGETGAAWPEPATASLPFCRSHSVLRLTRAT